jgi:ABC-type molybdate transport system ATPase subunit
MRVLAAVTLLLLALAGPVAAAGPLAQTFGVSVDHAWTTTERVLKVLGWDIDKSDRAIGLLTTDSRRVGGQDYGVYAKGVRHRLRLNIKAEGAKKTRISVERTLFKRERILWVDKDEPVTTTDQSVEKDVLAAIRKSL